MVKPADTEMHSINLFAQIESFRPEYMFAYISFSLVFLFLTWLVDSNHRPFGQVLVLWGILVAVFSGGYGLIGIPSALVITPLLGKISFLLVLSGVSLCALDALSKSPARSDEVKNHD